MLTLFKGSLSDTVVNSLVISPHVRDAIVVEGAGKSKVNRVMDAGIPVFIYQKAGEIFDPNLILPNGSADKRDAAVWDSAKHLVWKDAKTGSQVINKDMGWLLANIQSDERAAEFANLVVIPKIKAAQAEVKSPFYGIMLDNFGVLWPGLLSPVPSDFNKDLYYRGCRIIGQLVKSAFPDKKLIINGYFGYNDPGYRGLEYADFADYFWVEQLSRKVGGSLFNASRMLAQTLDLEWICEKQSRGIVGQDYVSAIDYKGRLSSLVEYLLVTTNIQNSYLHLDGTVLGWNCAEIGISKILGVPKGSMGIMGQFFIRRFENGIIGYNWSDSVAGISNNWNMITITSNLDFLYSRPNSVTLNPNEAFVALDSI